MSINYYSKISQLVRTVWKHSDVKPACSYPEIFGCFMYCFMKLWNTFFTLVICWCKCFQAEYDSLEHESFAQERDVKSITRKLLSGLKFILLGGKIHISWETKRLRMRWLKIARNLRAMSELRFSTNSTF